MNQSDRIDEILDNLMTLSLSELRDNSLDYDRRKEVSKYAKAQIEQMIVEARLDENRWHKDYYRRMPNPPMAIEYLDARIAQLNQPNQEEDK